MIGATLRNPQTQKSKLLSKEEEYTYIQQAKAGDERALKRLINKNQGLIKKEARKHEHHVEWRVLMAAGEVAIFKAVDGFDLSTGNKFSSYAVPVIYSEIRDCAVRETGIGRTTIEHLGKISQVSEELYRELAHEPTLEEIAEHCELSQQQVRNAWEVKDFSQPSSLNQRFEDDRLECLDLYEDRTVNVWRESENTETLDHLYQLEDCGHLDNRQARILIAKYQGYSNREVGQEFGLSRERIRQLVKSAKEKLTNLLEGNLKLTPIKTETPVSAHQDIEPIGEGDQLSLELPAPEVVKEPTLKRVDASRLGGRIGRAMKKLFTQTKESFDAEKVLSQSNQSVFESNQPRKTGNINHPACEADDHLRDFANYLRLGKARHLKSDEGHSPENLPKDSISRASQVGREINDATQEENSPNGANISTRLAVYRATLSTRKREQDSPAFLRSASRRAIGGLIHAEKPILALGRRSNHGSVDVARHQFASTDQRCHRLGGIQDAWGGCLGIGQGILSIFLLPLAFVYLAARGFQENRIAKTRRPTMHSFATNVFKFFGMGYRKENPRPPNDLPDTDEESS